MVFGGFGCLLRSEGLVGLAYRRCLCWAGVRVVWVRISISGGWGREELPFDLTRFCHCLVANLDFCWPL